MNLARNAFSGIRSSQNSALRRGFAGGLVGWTQKTSLNQRNMSSSSKTPKDRRVVVTGIGLVTPFGTNKVEDFWARLIRGESAIRGIDDPEILKYEMAARTAAFIRPDEFDTKAWVPHQIAPVCSRFEAFAVAASTCALTDAQWLPAQNGTERDQNRTGVSIGTGIGSLEDIAQADEALRTKGARRISSYALPRLLCNLAAGQVSIMHKLKGPNHCASTACTTGAHSIGDAYRFIKFGDADVMVAGGTESAVSPLGVGLFNRIHALSRKSFPDLPSSPFDDTRDGFVMGEGAGILVLEELEHALKRGVKKIYAELVGYGLSADAHHVTQPPESGEGAARAMQAALYHAGLEEALDQVHYVNAHATGTPQGDRAEVCAIARVFGAHGNNTFPIVSSTKGSLGHMLGGAGAVEAAVCALALHHQQLPPTVGVRKLDSQLEAGPRILYTERAGDPVYLSTGEKRTTTARATTMEGDSQQSVSIAVETAPVELYDPQAHLPPNGIRYAMSNSFAFGGSNASLVFKRWEQE